MHAHANIYTQVATNPLSLLVITALGGDSDFTIVDASEYCARGEAISFWRVLSRAQAAGDVLVRGWGRCHSIHMYPQQLPPPSPWSAAALERG
jgi:hypothetical protein